MLPLFVLLGCAHQGPVDVLDRFLVHEQRGEYDQSWRLLTSSDQSVRTTSDFARDHYEAGLAWVIASRQTTTKLMSSNEGPALATYEVKASHPDVAQIAQSMASLPAPTDAKQFEAAVAQLSPSVRERAFPVVEEHLRWTVILEDNRWRVWLGIAEQDALASLQVQAAEARKRADVEAEVRALLAIIAARPDPAGAVAKAQTDARARLQELGR